MLRSLYSLFFFSAGVASFISYAAEPKTTSGYGHLLALKSDGSVWAWGDNSHCELGISDWTPASQNPQQIQGIANAIDISVQENYCVTLKADGTVWAWGKLEAPPSDWSGVTYRFPPSYDLARYIPTQIPGLANVTAISSGSKHSLALRADGTVWGWGSNSEKQLGRSDIYDAYDAPVQIPTLSNVIFISSYGSANLAVKNDGTLWLWGATRVQSSSGNLQTFSTPTQIPSSSPLKKAYLAEYHGVALTQTNQIRPWGNGYYFGYTYSSHSTFPLSGGPAISDVKDIHAAGLYSVAVKNDGSVWFWGRNNWGQGGQAEGVLSPYPSPQPTLIPSTGHADRIIASAKNLHVILADGTIRLFGSSTGGEFGLASIDLREKAAQVPLLKDISILTNCYALDRNGTPYYTALNPSIYSGYPEAHGSVNPAIARNLASFSFKWISSYSHTPLGTIPTLAIDVANNAWMWENQSPPASLGLAVKQLSMNLDYPSGPVALKFDGTVWTKTGGAWLQITGTTACKSIAGTLILEESGKILKWPPGQYVASQILGLPLIKTIDSNSYSGSLDATALDYQGQIWLINGTGASRFSTAKDIAVVKRNWNTVLALDKLGKVWMWSSGTGPTQIALPESVVDIMLMSDYKMALGASGHVYNWGTLPSNDYTLSSQKGKLVYSPPFRLKPSASDSDADGILDSWEITQFGSLLKTGIEDSDLDGLPETQEFILGLDPLSSDTDSDGFSDFADAFPTDYYDGIIPLLVSLGGDNQNGAAGQFSSSPFDIAVWNPISDEPFVNAPVRFSVETGGGSLAISPASSAFTSLATHTDIDGTVQAYYKFPAGNSASTISVSAGPANLSLSAHGYSLSLTTDTDGDGVNDFYEALYGTNPTISNAKSPYAADYDGDSVINGEDADPTNAAVGKLSISISFPTSGQTLN